MHWPVAVAAHYQRRPRRQNGEMRLCALQHKNNLSKSAIIYFAMALEQCSTPYSVVHTVRSSFVVQSGNAEDVKRGGQNRLVVVLVDLDYFSPRQQRPWIELNWDDPSRHICGESW